MNLIIVFGSSKKKSDYRYSSKRESTGLFDRVEMGCVRMRGLSDDSKVFDLSNLKDIAIIVYNVEEKGRISFRRKIRVFFNFRCINLSHLLDLLSRQVKEASQ